MDEEYVEDEYPEQYYDDEAEDLSEEEFLSEELVPDDEFMEEEQDYVSEMKAFERAGGNMYLGRGAKGGTPLEIFKRKVAVDYDKLLSADYSGLNKTALDKMLNKASDIPNVKYKNPTVYLLGYIATQGGTKKLTKEGLNSAMTAVTFLGNKDDNIKEPDVIRYSVFWLTFLNK